MTRQAARAASEGRKASAQITQCAWCGAIGIGGGYDAVRHPIVNRLGRRKVSHGICPSCLYVLLLTMPTQPHSGDDSPPSAC